MNRLATGWSLIGVAAVFGWAVYRLGGRGLAAIQGGLSPFEWAALIAFTLFFVYTEGVLTFDRKWIPKLVVRSERLKHESTTFQVLAPLYGLSLVGRDWKEVAKGWIGTALIVTAVLIVRQFPPPWRGIVDFGVAAALAWGMVSILRKIPAAVR
ncbi:MAG: hypothetical protein HKN72_00245 [Gemmatimonadetes bacterium]|nr:hypothetical protein [Gemmatimonadota bacterium]NNF11621.1 hypothetical protein [Gemmatimonadota bacterium]